MGNFISFLFCSFVFGFSFCNVQVTTSPHVAPPPRLKLRCGTDPRRCNSHSHRPPLRQQFCQDGVRFLDLPTATLCPGEAAPAPARPAGVAVGRPHGCPARRPPGGRRGSTGGGGGGGAAAVGADIHNICASRQCFFLWLSWVTAKICVSRVRHQLKKYTVYNLVYHPKKSKEWEKTMPFNMFDMF